MQTLWANATAQLAQQLSQQNGGLQQVGAVQTLKLGGPKWRTPLELRGRSPLVENGTTLPERDWLVTIASPDGDPPLQSSLFLPRARLSPNSAPYLYR